MRWILVFFVLIGDFLIIKKNRIGFYLWIIVDGYFSFCTFSDGNFVESAVFLIYFLMGIYGLYIWKPGD